MDLGEKLRQARLEAGLSQRQLCGDIITRNMLSQIEHGAARPSMDTLRSLASRLGKPVSYFLEEDGAVSPNQRLMEQARMAQTGEAWLILKAFQHPDPVLEWEWKVRSFLAALDAAEQALADQKKPYAKQLLEEAAAFDHGIPALERQRLLLLGRISGGGEVAALLPLLDEELMLRAEAAWSQGNGARALELLAAAEQKDAVWHLLQGKALIRQREYEAAVVSLEQAEVEYPDCCAPLLEECFRELGIFQKAYEYACRQRKKD